MSASARRRRHPARVWTGGGGAGAGRRCMHSAGRGAGRGRGDGAQAKGGARWRGRDGCAICDPCARDTAEGVGLDGCMIKCTPRNTRHISGRFLHTHAHDSTTLPRLKPYHLNHTAKRIVHCSAYHNTNRRASQHVARPGGAELSACRRLDILLLLPVALRAQQKFRQLYQIDLRLTSDANKADTIWRLHPCVHLVLLHERRGVSIVVGHCTDAASCGCR